MQKNRLNLRNVIAIATCLVAMLASCEKTTSVEVDTPQVNDVTFTKCINVELYLPPAVFTVDFTNSGVNVTHYLLDVNCAFDTVLVTYTFENGILTITEQGAPNSANCICKTNVSYTIGGISEENIDKIVINGEVAWTANQQQENSLIGKWSVTPSYNSVVEITENNINFIIESNEIWSYQWISNDSIGIVRPDTYPTRNKVVFHTRDSVTVKGFWLSDAAVYPPESYDAILTRIFE